MSKSKIEWTGHTWNPLAGCSVLTPGCKRCYAMKLAKRLGAMGNPLYKGLTQDTKGGAVWTGEMRRAPRHTLFEPLHRKKPTTWFVNSMSDLFHENVPDEWIDQIFAVMALAPQHTFQILTKRAARMRDYCSDQQTPFRVAQAIDALSAQRNSGLEEVRPIAGYPGYFASSHGFIYSEKRGRRRRMSPDEGEEGHQRVQLHREGKDSRHGDRLLVHRIILETFIGPPPTSDAQGRHRDRVPSNNAVSNLSWGDQSANWDDAKRHGSHRRYSKLTENQAADIRRRHAAGETGESLAREFEVSATQVRNIAAGKQWAVASPIEWPLGNVWKGISTERQQEADERIPHLLRTPAAVRFISAEPLLGPIDLTAIVHNDQTQIVDATNGCHAYRDREGWEHAGQGPNLDWVIIGGESGHGYRDMDLAWARSIMDQCLEAGVAVFFKQMAGKRPIPADFPYVRQFPGTPPI